MPDHYFYRYVYDHDKFSFVDAEPNTSYPEQWTEEINVLDVFAGCGGLSLGFSLPGINIKWAIEKVLPFY
jgi:hypothetical protein